MKRYPLTHTQQGIILDTIRYPESLHYNIPGKIELPLTVDMDRLEEAARWVFSNHSVWHIRFVPFAGGVEQYIADTPSLRFERISIPQSEISKFEASFIRPFRPFSDELCRISLVTTEEHNYAFFDIFHAIGDGYSAINLVRDVGDYYDGNIPAIVNDQAMLDLALEQKQFDASDQHAELEAWFRERFVGKEIGKLCTEPSDVLGNGLEYVATLDRIALEKACAECGMKMSNLVNAAYALMLSSLSGCDSVAYLTPFHGRNRSNLTSHGTFISTMPMQIDVNPDETVREFVARMGLSLVGLMRRRQFDYTDLVSRLGITVETFFTYQGPGIKTIMKLDGVEYQASQTRTNHKSTAALTMALYDREDLLDVHVECSSAIHDESYLKAYAKAYCNLITQMVDNPDLKVRDLSLISARELPFVRGFCTEPSAPSLGYSLFDALKRNAGLIPDAVAIESDEQVYTYSLLWEMSGKIAASLRGKSGFVIIKGEREARTVAAMLGVMRAGLAFVPVDPSYPRDRIEHMIADSAAEIVLDDETIRDILEGESCGFEDSAIDPESPAYMIYTSGSSGLPKGVEISHRAMWAFVQGISAVLSISPKDRISCHSSFAFDASIEDIWPVLAAGGTLLIVPERLRKDIKALAEWLDSNNVTGGNYTTRLGQLMLEHCDLTTLRYIVLGGEKMTVWPERGKWITTYNTYGPTEFTVDASWHKLNPDRTYDDIPLGRPMPGQTAMIFDHRGNPLPLGFQGELCLAGPQMATRYHTGPAMPMYGEFYRTGDIARWNARGELEYIARRDGQVKVRGFRIELSEIDNCILKTPGVSQSKTIVDKSGNAVLSYIIADPSVDSDTVLRHIRGMLPSYMMPSSITRLEEFPLNPSGKLDVSGLPAQEFVHNLECVQAEGDAETFFLGECRRLLRRDDFGVTDDLFGLGLSSLQVLELTLSVNESGLAVISVSDVYEGRNIRSILRSDAASQSEGWYNESDNPVLVVIGGITPTGQLRPSLDVVARKYHVLFFPALEPSEERSMKDIASHYADVIISLCEEEPSVVTGHSFGGEIAYHVSLELQSRKSWTPYLVLFDTARTDFDFGLSAEDASVVNPSAVLFRRLHDPESMTSYEGKLRLFAATRSPLCEQNIESWTSSHPSIRIKRIDAGHDDLLQITKLL